MKENLAPKITPVQVLITYHNFNYYNKEFLQSYYLCLINVLPDFILMS